MLTSVTLTNFRTHKSLTLDKIPQVSILVGRNNAGKSAVLQALAWPKYGTQTVPILQPAEMSFRAAGGAKVEVEFFPSGGHLGSQGEFKPGPGGMDAFSANINDYRSRVFYVGPGRSPPRAYNYAALTLDVGVAGELTWPILRDLRDIEDGRFEAVVEWLRKLNLGVDRIGTPSESANRGAVAAVTFGDRLNVALTGSGLGAVLPIVTQGILCPKGSLFLVEEPESHLHRAAMDGLWEFFGDCAKRGVQVMATTHSLDLLASLSQRIEDRVVPPDSAIFHFRRGEDGVSTVKMLDPKLFANISKVLKADLAGHDL